MVSGDAINDIKTPERGHAPRHHLAASLAHAASVIFCCRCYRSERVPRQVLPYDNTRDQDVSLRELYGQADEDDNIKVTWVTGSSETTSEVLFPCTSADEHLQDAQHSTMSRMQSFDSNQPQVLQQLHALAEVANSEPDQTALSCIPPLEQTNLKNHNTKSDQVDAAATAKQVTANLQEQVCVLEEQKECLQGEVVTLQRQLTWLQSHASLQDQINKDLMQEVLHLREAVASLSVTPFTES
ncbi:hypothetical protein ABBQ38_007987 [Trebouxia sp. C0009 RCD-2024]